MFRPKHFSIEELTPKHYGDWTLLDEKLLMTLDELRELFNAPMTVNNWHIGGPFSLRGWRPKNASIGAPKSMHKVGKAADFDVKDLTPEQAREKIRKWKLQDGKLKYLTGMEVDVNWVHIDVRDFDGFLQFKPAGKK
jgi:hypothetical protein